ncbi:hypothetical protein DFH11DRAFT_130726 [Phellopilus nigrolimitatus]|nr:hypothetical protein DFH11DRAFT_130726 [Phellopilus nigrolimitatus]
MMQTVAYRPSPLPAPSPASDPVRASVAHLLARAHGIPCTAAAQAFVQLVQPTARFAVALDVLLPLLSGRAEVCQSASNRNHAFDGMRWLTHFFACVMCWDVQTPRRILSTYILYFLYAAHPIAINPFRSAFVEVFLAEREGAQVEAERGGVSENEQLVWVLWKILKGDGNDLGPYSPATLARSPLPPKLRAAQLIIDDALSREEDDLYEMPVNERLRPSPIVTNGLSPAPSAAHTPIENGNRMRVSPLLHGDDPKSEIIDQAMRLLLAACQRVLTLSEQRIVSLSLPHFAPHVLLAIHNLPPLFANNPALGHPLIVSLLKGNMDTVSSGSFTRADVLDVLRQLPPTLPSFDVIGRLLRDPTLIQLASRHERSETAGADRQQLMNDYRTASVADIVRSDVLGAFVLNAIGWVERSEQEAVEGLISDDRAAKGVQNLCRFYNSLIKLGLVDASSDADSAEMAHFALAHAHYEDANALYRVLVMGKF